MTRSSIFTVSFLVALLVSSVFVGVVFTRNFLHSWAQLSVSHVNQQRTNIVSFPVVHSHALVDRYGNPKIVLLHKSTRQSTRVPFYWVDLIAIDPPDRQLRCIVDGNPVEIESDVQVFFAIDDSKPAQRLFDSDTIVPQTPEAKWNAFAVPWATK